MFTSLSSSFRYHHCQVTLTVIYPEAFIHGGEEYHVDAGSPVALTCVIGKLDCDGDYGDASN